MLPKAYARTGYAGDYFLVGQWFPKIAVYEPAGVRGRAAGGWNAHQFHADSEFYADFGHYRVAITLPRRFVVGATGVAHRARDHGDGTTTHTYEQGDVHDFAWTASPRFVEITRRFDAAREVSAQDYRDAAARLGRSIEELRLGDVEVRLLMWPDHLPQAERYLRTTMRAIAAYGLAYGRYPHRTLTIVDPPDEAIGTGGMDTRRSSPPARSRRSAPGPWIASTCRRSSSPTSSRISTSRAWWPRTSSRRRGSTRASPSGRPGGCSTRWSAPIDRSSSWPACALGDLDYQRLGNSPRPRPRDDPAAVVVVRHRLRRSTPTAARR